MLEKILNFLSSPVGRWALVLAIGFVGLIIAEILGTIVGRTVRKKKDAHAGVIARKLVFYSVLFLALFACLSVLELPLATLVASASVLGIAIGFAAQTSFSNIISGLFLIFERPFKVGDAIKLGTDMGTVVSIDLLSVKLRTFDNLLIRIPNESVVKSNITNFSGYDIRRVDIAVSIAYGASIDHATTLLKKIVEEHPKILVKPDPEILIDKLGESGVDLTARVWFDREGWVLARTQVLAELKKALDDAGIEIPFPHRKLLADPELLTAIGRGKTKQPDKNDLSPEQN